MSVTTETNSPYDSEHLESRRAQLAQLQTRITSHGTRMWQLPLTYLGGIAVALTAEVDTKLHLDIRLVFGCLALLGFIVFFCLLGAREGYMRATGSMRSVEQVLGLGEHTKAHPLHIVPYFALVVFGTGLCAWAALRP